jgi:hypothetical protein
MLLLLLLLVLLLLAAGPLLGLLVREPRWHKGPC